MSIDMSAFPMRLAGWGQTLGFFGLVVGSVLQSRFDSSIPLAVLQVTLLAAFPVGGLLQVVAVPWLFFQLRQGIVPRVGASAVCIVGFLYAVYVAFGFYVCSLTPQCSVW